MTADVQNAAILVDAVDALAYLPTQYVELRRIGKNSIFPLLKILADFPEYPWRADSPPAYHDAVYTEAVEASAAPSGDVMSPLPITWGISMRGHSSAPRSATSPPVRYTSASVCVRAPSGPCYAAVLQSLTSDQ